jgi:hypothetical protein
MEDRRKPFFTMVLVCFGGWKLEVGGVRVRGCKSKKIAEKRGGEEKKKVGNFPFFCRMVRLSVECSRRSSC